MKRVKKEGKLKVYNGAAAWATAYSAAWKSFNALALGAELVDVTEEKEAHVVVILANGPMQKNHYGDVAKTNDNFTADKLHGDTSTLVDKRDEIFFAAVFLPGKVKKLTDKQKEVILVHEFIHAAGLNGYNDPRKGHDSEGIMFDSWAIDGDGLIEYLHDKNAKAMPPFRVGGKTRCEMQRLWLDKSDCDEK